MEEPKQDIKDFFLKLTELHGLPLYVTLRLDADGSINIIGVASNDNDLRFSLALKRDMDYFG